MFYRFLFSALAIFSLLFSSFQTIFAFDIVHDSPKFELPDKPLFYNQLEREPVVRIGLMTSASSVAITTTDASLVATSPDEPQKFLETAKVTVTARAYRPPEIDIYKFEIPNIATQAEAEQTLRDFKEAMVGEQAAATIALDAKTNTWRVSIGDTKDTIEEANDYKAFLNEKGFEEAQIVTQKIKQPSSDAFALSRQLKAGGKSEVRSIIKPQAGDAKSNPNLVKTIGSSQPTISAANPTLDSNLREVIVSGTNPTARFTSLKSVAFGSVNERVVPVRVNGKAYRGRIEVFVNARGNLTIVNAVSLEDYLLGVVPNELSLPALEAQKAQAIAARTYAVANINQFGSKGFDLLPTVRSQVYRGFASETKMGTQAVTETRGVVATYNGKPITAYYTSTCGGRTENSENVFDHKEPYLRGVECSLEGRQQFEPFLVKTVRLPAKLRDEQNLELVRLMSLLAVNGFQLSSPQLTDDFFDDAPTQSEMSNWLNQIAGRLGKTFPNVNKETAKPLELARVLAQMLYGDASYADTLLSEADVNYQLAFDDAAEIPKERRADVAILLRDGFFAIYPDLTLKPNKPFSRAKMLRVIEQIYKLKKFMPALQSGTTQAAENGKLLVKSGKTNRQLFVRPDVFLFREFGGAFYQVKETALVGGETVNFQTDASGSVMYLEVEPTTGTATAEKMSPFTIWNVNLSPSVVQSRLSRYVRGIGSLIDVRIAQKGFSRRAIDLEIVGTNGTFHLKGGKIRSALKLKEQLFVLNKRYDASGRATYSFTGRGWGHGIGMCQYGAYGLAKMGVKYDAIVKHYYTGIDLTKAY